MEKTQVEKLDELLLTEKLSDNMARAEAGDVIEARRLLPVLAHFVSRNNQHPVPDFIRDYLARSLWRMVEQEDANRAMNLKKSGKQKWAHYEKRLAANIVFELVEQSHTPTIASEIAADQIREFLASNPCAPAWEGFKGRSAPGADILRTWYYELKDELTEMRRGIGFVNPRQVSQ